MINRQRTILVAAAALAGLLLAGWGLAQSPGDPLAEGFRQPPDSAKPRTWWHWTNGNVTKEGITKDLEWMKRTGIGGFQLADVASGSGQTVPKKILFGTPEWLDAVRHASAEAQRLGLEMSIFSSPGWSEAGGPWVKPQEAMKRLVWSETDVEGPRHFTGKLAQPPSNNGPVRDLATGGGRGIPGAPPRPPDPTYYGDSAVVAYRAPADGIEMASLHPKVTTSSGAVDATALLDGSLNSSVAIHAPEGGGPAWLQFEFAQSFPARAISIGSRGGIPVGRLLASQDGTTFSTVATLPGPQGYHGAQVRTFAFPTASARFFRLELTDAPLTPAAIIHGGPIVPARDFNLSEAILYSDARVNRWEDKGAFGSLMDVYEPVPTPASPSTAEIDRGSVIDLTSKMSKDGSLEWEVPAGKWTVLRMGYALTGAKNRPAGATGLGFEVDKLNAKYVENYFHGYMDPIARELGPLLGTGLQYMIMDSWEAGMQNWTDEMIGEFRKRRDYDPTPYLPVLAGRVVQSAEVSDRFLWDFRRTLADLYADQFYGVMASLLRQRGMGSYAEASGVALEILEDTLLNKSKVDIPMAEFWVHALHPESMYYVDVRGAASAAHVYNKPIVATESFTGGGYESPYTLKEVSDYWFAQGVNRLVFHTSAHQPLDTKPGNTMVGTHINRNITWAELGKPFMAYLARNSFLLQQGQFVADLAYLLPEGAPSTMPFWGAGLTPPTPAGYDFDYVNTDVLLHRMSVSADGRVTLQGGMSYRVLVLPETEWMTPEVIRKIHELVAAGATVVGPRALRSPSLAGYPESDQVVRTLAMDLWGDADGITKNRHSYGKGQVFWGLPLSDVLTILKEPKDFEPNRPLDASLAWIHRRAGDADIYFVANRTDSAEDLEARFRVTGKDAQIWHPDTGDIEPAAYTAAGGSTTVSLRLADHEAVFVVFRGSAAKPSRTEEVPVATTEATLNGPWDIRFPSGMGAPASLHLEKLQSWTENQQEGVKNFSGTATYTKTVEAPRAWFHPGAKVVLDLGTVKDLAEVAVNGKAYPLLWKPPYQVDVTGVLKPGGNQVEVKVTNEWTNRVLGDRLLPEDKRILPPSGDGRGGRGGFGFGPNRPVESGLIGPVTVVSVATH